ncbi:MAG: hypothetical protein ACUVRJ_10985, partial [Candidatus Villigracilaceae bacterium]
WKAIAWFPSVSVRALTPADVSAADPSGLAFWNVNTPAEFAQAERLASQFDRSIGPPSLA